MVLDKLEYILALLAGLGVAIGGAVLGLEFTTLLLHLLIVMAAFFVVGMVVRIYLRAKVFPHPVDEDEEDHEEFEEHEEPEETEKEELEEDDAQGGGIEEKL